MNAYDVAANGGSIKQIVGAGLIGGASGFVKGGKVSFNAFMGLVSNLSGQLMDPNFSGFDISQALTASILAGSGLSSKQIDKLIKNDLMKEYISRLSDKGIIWVIEEIQADLLSDCR